MVKTRTEHLADLHCILREVIQFDEDGPVEKALIKAGYDRLHDFLQMDAQDLDDIEVVEGPTDNPTTCPLKRVERGKIEAFQSYLIYRQTQGNPVEEDDFPKLNPAEFNRYKLSP